MRLLLSRPERFQDGARAEDAPSARGPAGDFIIITITIHCYYPTNSPSNTTTTTNHNNNDDDEYPGDAAGREGLRRRKPGKDSCLYIYIYIYICSGSCWWMQCSLPKWR